MIPFRAYGAAVGIEPWPGGPCICPCHVGIPDETKPRHREAGRWCETCYDSVKDGYAGFLKEFA